MAAIEFRGVTEELGDGTVGVDDLPLEIADGEFMISWAVGVAARRRRCACSPASNAPAPAIVRQVYPPSVLYDRPANLLRGVVHREPSNELPARTH
jgi:hypothetical protein